MRRIDKALAGAALVLASGSVLVAQTSITRSTGSESTPARDETQPTDKGSLAAPSRETILVPSEWVIGMKVLDGERSKRLGTIKDLILDADDGHVVYALVNRAPREESSPAIVAVPWLAFTWDGAERILTLPVSRDRLAEAKTFETKRWDKLNDAAWMDETYGYYNVDRNAYEKGWQDPDTDEARNPGDPGHQAQVPAAHDQAGHDQTNHDQVDQRSRDLAEHDNAEAQRERDRNAPYGLVKASPTRFVLASKVDGQTLRGAEDKTIGDVDALVFDADSGRMAFIICEFGGFLGIGDSKVAVPWDYFKANDEGHLYTNEVKAGEVRTAPRLEKADWSELRDPDFGPRVYQHFGRDPSWFKTGFERPIAEKDADEKRSDNR